MKIKAFSAGYFKDGAAAYGVILKAIAEDGREIDYQSANSIDKCDKTQVDLVAAMMALRCIKPEHRELEIEFHIAGFANSMLATYEDGRWKKPSKTALATEVGETVSKFPKITFIRLNRSEQSFKECIEIAKQTLCQ